MNWVLDCLYLLIGVCLLPYWLRKLPAAERYRAGILQRLGWSPEMPDGRRRLWIHCASVGEAAIPGKLVEEFRRRHPGWQVVFSTNTDTGAARLRELYPWGPVFYMPLDFSPCVRLALRRVRPDVVLLVELELWPNFAGACRTCGVPMGIINGRIGAGSRRLLAALHRLCPRLWDPLRVCCARSLDDAAGFRHAGVPSERVFNCGLLKCDQLAVQPDAGRREELGRLFGIAPDDLVLVAGSTHQGEEAILAAAYR
ncbi:MAG: 3-deoxy-D-manno-octulosonic acid transferase, partial [Candidatus Brocadiae bacterium]|nr:3-deoxy-D-manno-octulosonic acid transferase [Candidatus Brocadiia bacterium]